jgi:hypothetical protein
MLNEQKTSLKNARQERFDFLGYSFGQVIYGERGVLSLERVPRTVMPCASW